MSKKKVAAIVEKQIALQQPRSVRGCIRESEGLRLPQRLLDARVPLNRIGQLQMGRDPKSTLAVCQARGAGYRGDWNRARSRRAGKRSRRTIRCQKSWSAEAIGSKLLTGVKENATAATKHRLPSRIVPEDVSGPQPRREVVPSGLPQWRALWRQVPVAQACRHKSQRPLPLRYTRRRIHLPPKPHRERQPARNLPFVLHKSGEVCIPWVGRD